MSKGGRINGNFKTQRPNIRFPARPHPFTLQRERASGKALTFLPGMCEMGGNLG